MVFHSARIAPDETFFEPSQALFHHVGAGLECRFAEAGQSLVGMDFEEDQVAPSQRDLVDVEAGDLQLAGRGAQPGWEGGAEGPKAGSSSEVLCAQQSRLYRA